MYSLSVAQILNFFWNLQSIKFIALEIAHQTAFIADKMMMRLHVPIESRTIPSTEDMDQAEVLQHPERPINSIQ